MKNIIYLLLLFLSATILHAANLDVDSIDYANPKKYLDFPTSLGDKKAITEQALKLKGKSDRATIRNVLDWMEQNLTCENEKAYAWRNYDDVIREKIYGACADQAIVCGVLLKSAGIPAVWVKTMDVSWIWDFKKGRPFQSWSGHVYLEVYTGEKWALLDPGGRLLYESYDTKARVLPGQRFAYHKGNDPKEMVMSLQWEEWKIQTREYFQKLDESLLPADWGGATRLVLQADIIGNPSEEEAKEMREMSKVAGFSRGMRIGANYDTWLPMVNTHTLLIHTRAGRSTANLEALEKYFPGASQGLKNPDGMVQIDGTTLVFVDFSNPDARTQFSNRLKKLKASFE